jgi:geranylgeranyl diphosphate synthase type II
VSSVPVPIAAAPAPACPARSPLEEFLDDRLGELEARLDAECRALGGQIGGLAEGIARAVGTQGRGGARWRPLLTLAAASRGARESALDVAVAVELTHTASLVLDDLPCMDDAAVRRGQPATHRLIGSAGAILLSVGLLARATELLGRQPCGGALCAEWGRTVGFAGMAGGQAMDVAGGTRLRGSRRRLHRAKSTALPAFALSAGARLAGVAEPTRRGLEAFGRGLGWAYQLFDDEQDRDEDARQGRPSTGTQPATHSARILRQARRRLAETPALDDEVLAILVGLATRIVPTGAPPPRPIAGMRERRR